MGRDAIVWLFLGVILSGEYGWKQYFEDRLEHYSPSCLLRIYLFSRGLQFLALTLFLPLLFSTPWSWLVWPLVAFLTVLLGMGELLLGLVGRKYRLNSNWRLLNFLPFFFLAFWGSTVPLWLQCHPGLGLEVLEHFLGYLGLDLFKGETLKTMGVFLLLTHPTNYAIRWLMGKEENNALTVAFFVLGGREGGKGTPSLARWEIAAADNEARTSLAVETLKAGRGIGILERWVLVLLMVAGQFSSIGFVLAAKSIARFKKLDEPHFAEYYLLGTLYSVLFALLFGLILLH